MTTINWQQPFVNTFKHFTIASDKNVIKHGDITTILDNQIKSSVYKIVGSSPMSNFINMPKLSGQSLGLTGRYIYFLFKPMPNKFFSIHIDVNTVEKQCLRVSFSNLFKEFKSTSTWLQFPYVIQSPKDTVYEKLEQNAKDMCGAAPPITKWTILCVDLSALIKSYANRTYHCVRGFKLCANILIKNVITSDILYEPGMTHAEARMKYGHGLTAFPRELSYPCEKYENWHNFYDFIIFPSNSCTKPFDSVGQSRVLSKNDDKTTQRVETQLKYRNSQIDIMVHPNKFLSTNKIGADFELPLVGVANEEEENSYQIENKDIHVYPFKTGNCLASPSSNSTSSSNSSSYRKEVEEDLINENNKVENYRSSLEPDPILELKKIIGFGSRQISKLNLESNLECNYTNSVKWTNDCQYLVYCCQAIVVAYQINTAEQLCFVGHSERVSCLALSPDNSILASGQAGPYSLIRLWNFKTRKCITIFRHNDHHSLYLLEFSQCGNYLCGVGKDKQGKNLICLWDVKEIIHKKKNNSSKLIAKAHTDSHITRLVFVSYDSSRLITCGRDNVRFWRLKNDSLRSCAVNLAPYIQALNMNPDNNNNNNINGHMFLEFTDICMNSRPDNNDNLVYACTLTGQIFVFNMAKQEIEHVRMLEPMIKKTGILNNSKSNCLNSLQLRLNSLTVSDLFCTTGSEDGYVRIWPLDFSQVSVEAEHEAPIGLVRFSPDCMKIATATLNGNLGILDLKNKEYLTLIRSHTNSIRDLAYDSKCKYISTVSNDGTIRIWDYRSLRQLYDFSSDLNGEKPTCIDFSPNSNDTDESNFACAFNTGKIRIFSVRDAKLLHEINSPHIQTTKNTSSSSSSGNLILNKFEITDLKYASDGKRLISGDVMKYLCLYDTERNYCLIRMLPNCISVSGSLKISPDSRSLATIGSSSHLITVYESFSLNEILRIDITVDSNEILTSLYDNGSQNYNNVKETAIKLEYASYGVNQLLCATASKKLLKFDSKTGRLLSSITNIHKNSVNSMTVSNDGKFLVTSGDNLIKVWDYEMRLEKNFQTFIGHSSSVNKVLFSPDNQTLISVGDSIIFWDFLAYKSIENTEVHIDGKKVTSIYEGRELEEMRDKPICSVIRELNKKSKNNHSEMEDNEEDMFDLNEIKILNEKSFEKMMNKNCNKIVEIDHEKPRTPPQMHIETIEATGCNENEQIEDDTLFLNDDLTILDNSYSNSNNLHDSKLNLVKNSNNKFANLPTFVTSSIDFSKVVVETNNNSSFINGTKFEKHNDSANYNNIDEKIKSPSVNKHLQIREKQFKLAKLIYTAPPNQCAIKLNSIIGYNGQHSTHNMIWSPSRELFAFTVGKQICIEDLKTGKQTFLSNLNNNNNNKEEIEDIACLTLRNDCIQMASASGSLITIWDCLSFEQTQTLSHKNAHNITCMSFSSDDRYLISISDFNHTSISLWKTQDGYSLLTHLDMTSIVINDLAFNPFKTNEFTICGQNKLLETFQITPNESKKLKQHRLELPILFHQIENDDDQDSILHFTSLTYSHLESSILYAATNKGLITVWNLKQMSCFLDWQAEQNVEIGVLISYKNKLITGASNGCLKLWNVKAINEMFKNNNLPMLRLEGLTIENEVILNQSIIKSCKFDANSLDIGIVATNRNTIWYVNWKEESSVRLVTTHMSRINQICCFNGNKCLSTVSDDGSLNVWSICDRERLVQFEVKSKANCQALIDSKHIKNSKCSKNLILVGYSDGCLRLFDVDKKAIVSKLKAFQSSHKEITSISYCKQTEFVLVGTQDGNIGIVNLSQNKLIKTLGDHKGSPITSLDNMFKSDLNLTYWVARSKDKKISIWCCNFNDDLFQMIDMIKLPSQIEACHYSCNLAQFVPNTDLIAYIGHKKQILFYDINKKAVVRSMNLTEWPRSMTISSHSSLIALGTNSRLLQIKDFNEGTFQDFTHHSDSVSSVCFSGDGRKLFSTAYNEIFIWDILV